MAPIKPIDAAALQLSFKMQKEDLEKSFAKLLRKAKEKNVKMDRSTMIDEDLQPTEQMSTEAYATRKTAAHGLITTGLMVSTVSQLKTLFSIGSGQDFYIANIILIILSMVLQVSVGGLLTLIGVSTVEKQKKEPWHKFIIGITGFIITLNVITAALGVEN